MTNRIIEIFHLIVFLAMVPFMPFTILGMWWALAWMGL